MSGNFKHAGKKYSYHVKRPAVAKLAKQVKTLVKAAAKPNKKTAKFPFGMERTVTEKYGDFISYAMPTANVVYEKIYRMNSTQDPDLSAAGHQPYGRDDMAKFFNRYRVNSFRYKIDMVNITPNTVPLFGVTTTNETSPLALPSDVIEQARSIAQLAPNEHRSFSGTVKLDKLAGLSPAQYQANMNTQAAVGGDPVEVQVLTLHGLSDVSTTVKTMVTLWYNVTYFDPIHQNGS